MPNNEQITIKTPVEEKHKLIKWYGWITIIVLCLTPLVFILLPVLVVNTSRIGRMLRESRVPEEQAIRGKVLQTKWKFHPETGLHHIKGQLIILADDGNRVECSFFKYVAPNQKSTPDINAGDHLEITGQFRPWEELDQEGNIVKQPDRKVFAIRNVRNLRNGAVYTTEPILRVY